MTIPKSIFIGVFIVKFLSDVSLGWCSQDHPLVQNIKTLLDKKVLSNSCNEALKIFIQNLDDAGQYDSWAFKMLDATSRVPVGLVSYSYGDIGRFYECIESESPSDNIKGKYCLGNIVVNASSLAQYYSVQHNQNLQDVLKNVTGQMAGNPTWAMCLPSNCSDEDSKILMTKSQPIGIRISSVTCQTIGDVYPKLTGDALIGISTLGFLTCFILFSTSYDLYCHNRKKANPVFIIFSLFTNGKILFQNPRSASNLSCLDGLRVLSMAWIIALHTWNLYLTYAPVFNTRDIDDIYNSIISMIFINGELACDTFLLVGGTLVTYVFFKKYKVEDLTYASIFRHYVHRIIRLTPPLAGLVLVSATLLRYLGSGPTWPYLVQNFEGLCKKNWWTTLLFIQNEVNVNKMCAGHTWYLDVDMQLYLFSPIIFWILSKYSKTGIGFLVFAAISSVALGFIRAFEEEMSGLAPHVYTKTSSQIYMNDYYLKTETRAAPWIMGTVLGYMLVKKGFTDISLPKRITIPMWILSFSVIILCVFGGFSTLRGPDFYKMQNAFYISLVRPSFAMAVAWIIWACSTNHGGIINSILSSSIFRFLNKFIYSMYLVHVTSFFMIIYSTKTSLDISLFNLAYWFWGIFMFMFGVSIIWVLVFECPMIALEKLIFPPNVGQKEEFIKSESKGKV